MTFHCHTGYSPYTTTEIKIYDNFIIKYLELTPYIRENVLEGSQMLILKYQNMMYTLKVKLSLSMLCRCMG